MTVAARSEACFLVPHTLESLVRVSLVAWMRASVFVYSLVWADPSSKKLQHI
jgi:hypothetical protein